MTSELGKCRICDSDASVEYPFLGVSFCSLHYNPRDAGKFGCDFSGPDDFDIPESLDYEDVFLDIPCYDGDYLWRTNEGKKLFVSEMSDSHIRNTLNMLRRNSEKISPELGYRTPQWIPIFEAEVRKRESLGRESRKNSLFIENA